MHTNNRKWLDDIKKIYPDNFIRAKVLELGSGVSGDPKDTIRPWFEDCHYVGVDRVAGPSVDIVEDVKDVKFFEKFYDTIMCFSMLEHDIHWEKSLTNGLRALKTDGMLFMCWGAEGNQRHLDIWELVPYQKVLDYLKNIGFEIVDSFFEEDRYGKDCAGCYNVIAKNK